MVYNDENASIALQKQRTEKGGSKMDYVITTTSAIDYSLPQLYEDGVPVFQYVYSCSDGSKFPSPATASAFDALYRSHGVFCLGGSNFDSFFDEQLEKHKAIVHICDDDNYREAQKAATRSMLRYVRSNVYVLNSHSFGSGITPLVCRAEDLKASGKTAEEIFVELNEFSKTLTTLFIVPVAHGKTTFLEARSYTGNENFSVEFRAKSHETMSRRIATLISDKKAYISCGSDTELAFAMRRRLNRPDTIIENISAYTVSKLGPFATVVCF